MLCGLKYYNNVGEFTAGTSFTQDGNGNVELVLLPRNQTQMMLFDMEGIPIAVRPEGGLPSYAVGSPNVEGQRTILGDKVSTEVPILPQMHAACICLQVNVLTTC